MDEWTSFLHLALTHGTRAPKDWLFWVTPYYQSKQFDLEWQIGEEDFEGFDHPVHVGKNRMRVQIINHTLQMLGLISQRTKMDFKCKPMVVAKCKVWRHTDNLSCDEFYCFVKSAPGVNPSYDRRQTNLSYTKTNKPKLRKPTHFNIKMLRKSIFSHESKTWITEINKT